MQFHILMEDGCLYEEAKIFYSKGEVKSKIDLYCMFRYEHSVIIRSKLNNKKKVKVKDIYELDFSDKWDMSYKIQR